jgi:hypothetical protein
LSTHLLFALLALCALESPSNQPYWNQRLRQHLQTFVSYHGQEFVFDPPAHRHTVYILHLVIAFKPTALIACQKSASAAVRGTTHVMIAYNIAKKCGFKSAASSLADPAYTSGVASTSETVTKAMDALLWCRTLIYDVHLEGSIVNPLPRLENRLDRIDRILHIVQAEMLKKPFPAAGIHLFHAVRCDCIEMQHYVRMRKARRDLTTLATIVDAHRAVCTSQSSEILQLLSPLGSREATDEESSVAASLVEMELNQSRARLLSVAIFYAVMRHVTSSNSDEEILPHDAVRVSTLVIEVFERPGSQELGRFLERFGTEKDVVVDGALADFAEAGKNLKLQRMPWLPTLRISSQEILFHCWLIVDHNIARINGGHPAQPEVEKQLFLFEQCAETLEAMSTPAGHSVDNAFANGCLYAASAKLIRCLRGILIKRTTSKSSSITRGATPTAQLPLPELQDIDWNYPGPENLDFDQIFGEWSNWPYNSTSDMLQLLPETVSG